MGVLKSQFTQIKKTSSLVMQVVLVLFEQVSISVPNKNLVCFLLWIIHCEQLSLELRSSEEIVLIQTEDSDVC